jgi:hypothetical protein
MFILGLMGWSLLDGVGSKSCHFELLSVCASRAIYAAILYDWAFPARND